MSHLPLFRNNHVHDPFTMDIWDPFRDFNESHHISPPPPHMPFHNSRITSFGGAKVEWNETPEAHVLKVDVPGLKREEVKVKVKEGKTLKISGKKKVEREEKHENGYHFERSKGKFLRVYSLPENSKPDQVRSCLENGVLTVTVPKRDVKKSHDVVKKSDHVAKKSDAVKKSDHVAKKSDVVTKSDHVAKKSDVVKKSDDVKKSDVVKNIEVKG